ncbi:MAG: pyrroline-5-carboxylate reductase [Deltaproteobacteria bacterium]|nr:pyrroline-5-carboxylate reductase [Deltaproteobacteria bacterium]
MGFEDGNIGFIGAGNMATALIKGIVESGLYDPKDVAASDVNREQLQKISSSFGIQACTDNNELVRKSGIVLLAVKPQSMAGVLEEIRENVRKDQLFISIAAGIPLKMIHGVLGKEIPVIRAMPNTPALILCGMIALASGPGVSSDHMDAAKRIFDAVGKTVVIGEEMMDAVTALSASGPGFIFRIMECFVEAGECVGFDRETSTLLVLQTFLGAARLAKESDKPLSALREMVTSPGGTTEAGLAAMERKGLAEVITSALKAARDRGIELGKMK